VNAKETRAGQLYTDILATLTRKQHLDNVQVLLNLFLTAMGKLPSAYATVKSPTALSRLLNHAPWSLTAMIRVMRHHAQSQLKAYRKRCVGRSPRLELIIDLTLIAKEGRFEGLWAWMHTLNSVQGVHVVLLYLCCGELRLPWSFLIWRGKGEPSPTQLALKLLHGLPAEVRNSSKTIDLLADGGFSSKAFIQGVIRLKFAGFIRNARRSKNLHWTTLARHHDPRQEDRVARSSWGFNLYDRTLQKAEFQSITTFGDSGIGMQLAKPFSTITVQGDIRPKEGEGAGLVRGKITTLKAHALSLKVGARGEALTVQGQVVAEAAEIPDLDFETPPSIIG